MSLTENKAVYDGMSQILRGMDSGRNPSLIGADQAAFFINSTSRPGFVENRPGWSKLTLTGDDFQLGRWQMASPYISPNGLPYIVASIGGHIVRFNLTSNEVLDLSTDATITNPEEIERSWFAQAETYLVIQNNSDIPLIFDGGTLRRANPVAFGGQELPVGNVMEYNNGRLWVGLPDRQSFSGGDLAYSVTGTAYDVLTSTQNQFLVSGQFALPANAGYITAMRSLAVQDSVLGQGPLIVFGQFGAATINAPFNADLWQNTDSPIVSIGLMSQGPTSDTSTININGDIWYRASDGVRTYMIARRDHGTWVNTPVSHEMERVLDFDDQHLLGFCSAVDFDNRRLETVSPYRATVDGTEYGVVWRGLSVLDFKPVSSMFDRSQPCWDGIWNGIGILQILTVKCYGIDRCFMFVLNDCHEIELWELSRASDFDNMTDRIAWTIETKRYGFKSNAELLNQLIRTETWVENLVGELDYTIQYRPDGYDGWIDLDSGSKCATTGICEPPGCTPPVAPRPQYRPRWISSAPSDTECEECNDKKLRIGYEFQFKLEFTGAATLRRFRAVASELPEKVTGGCLGEEDCCLQSDCEASFWTYETPNEC